MNDIDILRIKWKQKFPKGIHSFFILLESYFSVDIDYSFS